MPSQLAGKINVSRRPAAGGVFFPDGSRAAAAQYQ
jgi:hypothetical protein